jgi:hypothetical protein
MALPSHPRGEATLFPDVALASGLGLLALALYVASPIGRSFGDGSLLVSLLAAGEFGEVVYIHALYLPLARGLADLARLVGIALDPAATLLLLSQLSAAFGVAATFLIARGFGIGRRVALTSAVLLAISPPVWFFADTTEVHAPHFAAVGFVAVVTLFGPWRRPVLATLLMASCLPLVFLSHQSGLLLYPGWILLADVGRRRVASPLSRRALGLGVAPAVAAALAAALFASAHLRQITVATSFTTSTAQITAYAQGHLVLGLWQGWLFPLALLWLPLGAGLWHFTQRGHGSDERWRRTTLAALILPSLAFFLAWGVPERGAYSLGTAVFLAVIAGRGLEALARGAGAAHLARLRGVGLALALLIVAQAFGARHEILAFDRTEFVDATRARANAARAAFEGQPRPAVLLSIDPRGQTVTALEPWLHEASLMPSLRAALLQRESPAGYVERALALIDALAASAHPTFVLDRSYTLFLPKFPECAPYAHALESALVTRYSIHELPGPGGGFWRLDPHMAIAE